MGRAATRVRRALRAVLCSAAWIAAIGWGLSAVLLFVCSQLRPAADGSVQAAGITEITATGNASASFEGQVRGLHYDSSGGELVLVLPTKPTDANCKQIAADVGGSCDGGVVSREAALDATWDLPE